MLLFLPGEGDLKVRSVIEPWLSLRCRPSRPWIELPRPTMLPLPMDDCDPRLTMRLVCMLPTGSGVVVADRRAAAAAADDSPPWEGGRWPDTALAAARAAEWVLGVVGCRETVNNNQARDVYG